MPGGAGPQELSTRSGRGRGSGPARTPWGLAPPGALDRLPAGGQGVPASCAPACPMCEPCWPTRPLARAATSRAGGVGASGEAVAGAELGGAPCHRTLPRPVPPFACSRPALLQSGVSQVRDGASARRAARTHDDECERRLGPWAPPPTRTARRPSPACCDAGCGVKPDTCACISSAIGRAPLGCK